MAEQSDIIVDVTAAWLSGSTEASAVHIPALRGDQNAFMLKPVDQEELDRIGIANGYCPKCEGRGFTPVPFGTEMRPVVCLKCKGKSKPASDPGVRFAQLKTVCLGWDGWLTSDGQPVPFTDAVVQSIARNPVLAAIILSKAQELTIAFREADQGNSESGPQPSSGEATHLSTVPPEPSES